MFEGEIAQIDLLARMVEMWREQFTGAIRFENDGVIKIVYFKSGDVLSASTNDRADSVDEILMRAGKVSKEHVKQALAKRKESETLGDALLNLGFITRKELAWARRIQVINVIRSVDDWDGGSFTIVADYLPKRDEGTQYPLPQILVEMIVTDADRQKFEKALESGSVVFEKVGGWEDIFRKIGLNEDAEAIMGQVDGMRSASEVANASHQETFNAFKLMHALSLLGILRRKEAAVPIVPSSFDTAGVDDAADAWDSPAAPSIPATDSSLTQFTLDDEMPPALSIPAPEPSFSSSSFSDSSFSDSAMSEPALSSFSPSTPSFSTPPEPVSPAPTPSWEAPPPRGSSPILAPEPPPAAAADEGFGFDMAQVEAARKTFSQQIPTPGVKPIPSPRMPSSEGTMTRNRKAAVAVPAKKSSPLPLLIGLMLFFIAAAGGYFGYNWWTSRDAATAPVATATTATVAPPPTNTTPETVTIVPADTTAQQTTSTAPLPVVPAPVPVPAPVTQTASTLPRPTPQPVTGGDVKARYDAMAREFAANPAGSYTIQFAIVCDPSNVTKALRSSAADRVWFIPISVKERSCYRLFWGGFETREQADAALPTIPGELRESKPSVVTVPR